MARAIRWTVPFKSLSGISCRVDIYDEGWTGSVTTLQGSANPFEYSENNDEDLLNHVIRYRTGYLRVIEDNFGDLDALYPLVNTDRYIEFYYGDNLDFVGFIQAQAFEKDWAAGPRVVELPVISPLGLASSIKIDYADVNPPRWWTLRSWLAYTFNKFNANYTGFYFPQFTTQSDYTLVLSLYMNSMVFCPYGTTYDKTGDNMKGIYDPKMLEDVLTTICTGFGLIVHDVPGTPVFQRVDYQGNYVQFVISGGASQQAQGITDLTAIAEVNSDDNVQSVVMPLSRVVVTYDGEECIPAMNFDRCRGYIRPCNLPDEEFCTNSPMIADFEGTYTIYAGIDSNGRLDNGNICLGAFGSGSLSEMLVFRAALSWPLGQKVMTYTFFEYNGEAYRLRFKHQYGESIENLNNPEIVDVITGTTHATIGVRIKMGSMYLLSDGTWSSSIGTGYSKVFNDGKVDREIQIAPYLYQDPQPLTVEFFAVSSIGVNHVNTISDVRLEKFGSAADAYVGRNIEPVTYKVEGDPSFTEGSVGRGCGLACPTKNRLRYNSNQIDGTTWGQLMDAGPTYQFMLTAQDRIILDVEMSYQSPVLFYINRHTIWGSTGKWRTIARIFQPWNDNYRFTLHHSTVFDY